MMRCTLNRFRLSRAADDRSPPPPATLRHLESCEGCSEFRDSLETLEVTLASGRSMAPRPIDPPARPMTARPVALAALIASAAALMLVVWFSLGRTATLAEVESVDPDVLAPSPILIAKDDPPVDVDALAGDASGGIRYFLRVSGLATSQASRPK